MFGLPSAFEIQMANDKLRSLKHHELLELFRAAR